ncbi:hypothetical protein CB1_000327017 [Camelus ferus]|nr:hypothetical protein CB1_000327017 [Camelus ferus]
MEKVKQVVTADSVDEARGEEDQQEAEENLREDLPLESFAKDRILQITEGSEREGEKAGTKQAALDGEPLGGGQLAAVHLQPSEEQRGQEGGARQRGACTHRHRARPLGPIRVSVPEEGRTGSGWLCACVRRQPFSFLPHVCLEEQGLPCTRPRAPLLSSSHLAPPTGPCSDLVRRLKSALDAEDEERVSDLIRSEVRHVDAVIELANDDWMKDPAARLPPAVLLGFSKAMILSV